MGRISELHVSRGTISFTSFSFLPTHCAPITMSNHWNRSSGSFIGSGKWTVSLNFPPQMRTSWLKWISPLVGARIPAADRWPLLFPSPPYKLGELAAKFTKSHGLMPFPCCPFTFETASFPLSKTVKTVFQLQRIYFRSVWWKVSKYRDFLSCFSYFCFAANSIMKNWKEITLHCPIPF